MSGFFFNLLLSFIFIAFFVFTLTFFVFRQEVRKAWIEYKQEKKQKLMVSKLK